MLVGREVAVLEKIIKSGNKTVGESYPVAQSITLHLLDNTHPVASPDLKTCAPPVSANKLMNGESFDDFF